MYDIESKYILITRDVVFKGNIFPYKQTKAEFAQNHENVHLNINVTDDDEENEEIDQFDHTPFYPNNNELQDIEEEM